MYWVRHLTFFFRTMVVYTLVYASKSGPEIDLRKMPILAKKNHLLRWSSFWLWRVCKQVKLTHLAHRKTARIHWKTDAPKTRHCLMRILIQRHNWAILLRKWARRGRYSLWRSLLGHKNFVHKNWREGYWQHLVSGRRYVQHSRSYSQCFAPCFLKIALSAAELMSFGYIEAAIWRRWTIIYGVPSKISVMPTSQRQLTL